MAGEFHEPRELLSEKEIDFHRAISSLMEELEAVDWYRQRGEATRDEALRAIMDHHQREELEHAMMILEYMRRNDSDVANQAREYLFKDGDIVGNEEEGKSSARGVARSSTDGLRRPRATIGSLKASAGGPAFDRAREGR